MTPEQLDAMPLEALQTLFVKLKKQEIENSGKPDEYGFLDAFNIAAGKGVNDLWAGLQQLNAWKEQAEGKLAGAFGVKSQPYIEKAQNKLSELAANQAEADRLYAPLRAEHPMASSIGESTPSMVASLIAGGGPGLLSAVAKQSAATALPEALKYGDPNQRLVNAAKEGIGSGVGAGVGWGLGKLVTPIVSTKDAASQAAAQAAENLGVKLLPGEKTGSNFLRKQEQLLAQLPGSDTVMSRFQGANEEAINNAAARAMGMEPTGKVPPSMLDRASEVLSEGYKKFFSGRKVNLGTQDFFKSISDLEVAQSMGPPTTRSALVDGLINDTFGLAAKGKIEGPQYQLWRSQIKSAIRSSSNDAEKAALTTIKSAMEDAAEMGMTKTEQAAFHLLDKQYAAMKALEKGNAVVNANVRPAAVRTNIANTYKAAYKRGKLSGEINDIARMSEGVAPLRDSGTPSGMVGVNATTSFEGAKRLGITSPLRWLEAQMLTAEYPRRWLGNSVLDDEAFRRLTQYGGLLGTGYGNIRE